MSWSFLNCRRARKETKMARLPVVMSKEKRFWEWEAGRGMVGLNACQVYVCCALAPAVCWSNAGLLASQPMVGAFGGDPTSGVLKPTGTYTYVLFCATTLSYLLAGQFSDSEIFRFTPRNASMICSRVCYLQESWWLISMANVQTDGYARDTGEKLDPDDQSGWCAGGMLKKGRTLGRKEGQRLQMAGNQVKVYLGKRRDGEILARPMFCPSSTAHSRSDFLALVQQTETASFLPPQLPETVLKPMTQIFSLSQTSAFIHTRAVL